MTWEPMKPRPLSAGYRANLPVTVALQPGKLMPPSMVIVIRPALFDGLTFVAIGGGVSVMRGLGDHAGMLRLQRGTEFHFAATGGRKREVRTVLLRLPLLPGVAAVAHPPTRVEYDYLADWIELTLPEWAWVKSGGVPPLPPLPPAKAPFTGLAGREPDPAAIGRARAREVRS